MLLEYHDVNYFVLILLLKQLNISAWYNSCSRKGKLGNTPGTWKQTIIIKWLRLAGFLFVCYFMSFYSFSYLAKKKTKLTLAERNLAFVFQYFPKLRHYTSPDREGATRITLTNHVKGSHFQCKGDIFVLSYYWSDRESNRNPLHICQRCHKHWLFKRCRALSNRINHYPGDKYRVSVKPIALSTG